MLKQQLFSFLFFFNSKYGMWIYVYVCYFVSFGCIYPPFSLVKLNYKYAALCIADLWLYWVHYLSLSPLCKILHNR